MMIITPMVKKVMKMEKQAFNISEKYAGAKIICAVSGGADSLCMLHKFKDSNIVCAHFDHQIRDNSAEDAKYVEDICDQWNVPFVLGTFNVKKYSEDEKLSIELAARIKRYEFLIELAKKENAIIATAHNSNDSVESILMHLFRGAGLNGLTGIKDILMDSVQIIRPIIDMTRADIEKYCEDNNIKYLTDETNFDTTLFRNKIRHEILPHVDNLQPILRASAIISDENDYFDLVAEKWIVENRDLNMKPFRELHIAIKRRILFNLLKNLTNATISFERIEALIELIDNNVGNKTIQFPGGISAYLTKNVLTIAKTGI